jgi:hypothetical protein
LKYIQLTGDFELLAQVYLNWTGSTDEFQRVKSLVKDLVGRSDGVELEGLFVPSNKWNYSVLYKVDDFEKFLKFQTDVRALLKTENLAKIPERKLIMLINESEMKP